METRVLDSELPLEENFYEHGQNICEAKRYNMKTEEKIKALESRIESLEKQISDLQLRINVIPFITNPIITNPDIAESIKPWYENGISAGGTQQTWVLESCPTLKL